MVTAALRDIDVCFAAPSVLQDTIDDLTEAQGEAKRQGEAAYTLHRQAAQCRNGRLRKIEALQRKAK